MKWYDSPALVDRLAAEYALGTLSGPARRRFERVMHERAVVGAAVARWNERLYPMAGRLAPVPPSEALWPRIARQITTSASDDATVILPAMVSRRPEALPENKLDAWRRTVSADRPAHAAPSRWKQWWRQLIAPIPAGALAFGLAAGLLLPSVGALWSTAQQGTELPESYVGVLGTADGRPGLIVSSLRRGRAMDLKRVSPVPIPAGQTLYLWVIENDQTPPRPISALPDGPFERLPLPSEAETLFAKARELAVSLEPAGSAPAQPSGPFVYRGLCGKLWRLPPPATPASGP